MDFKDLQIYNKAMLAKQSWKVMNEETSLLHKVYKVRYFSDGNFLEVKLGKAPSYTWRGIWDSPTIIKQGCRWHVWDGKSIDILIDYQIPGHITLSRLVQGSNAHETGEKQLLLSTLKWVQECQSGTRGPSTNQQQLKPSRYFYFLP